MSLMLKEFDRICRKHKIRYFLVGGSLLGALLYKGWIPWDGDIDLVVNDSDYNKFKNIIQKELPNDMWYQDTVNDKTYKNKLISKIRSLSSCYSGYSKNHKKSHNGLQIDILKYSDKNKSIKFYDNHEPNMLYEDIYPLREVPFENFSIFIMNKSEKYLTNKYGKKWTEILPVNKRYPHEGKMDPYNTCDHHYKLYPELYKN